MLLLRPDPLRPQAYLMGTMSAFDAASQREPSRPVAPRFRRWGCKSVRCEPLCVTDRKKQTHTRAVLRDMGLGVHRRRGRGARQSHGSQPKRQGCKPCDRCLVKSKHGSDAKEELALQAQVAKGSVACNIKPSIRCKENDTHRTSHVPRPKRNRSMQRATTAGNGRLRYADMVQWDGLPSILVHHIGTTTTRELATFAQLLLRHP